MPGKTGYEEDFNAWAGAQAAALRAGRFDLVDTENLSEELDEMGRGERKEMRSHLVTLLAHLIKHVHQPDRRGSSWENTIQRARLDIDECVMDSPSLKPLLADQDFLLGAWKRARLDAASEMEISRRDLPEVCPWAIGTILDEDFAPDAFEDGRPQP